MNSKKAVWDKTRLVNIPQTRDVLESIPDVGKRHNFIIIHGIENVNPKLGRCVAGQ